MNYDRTKLLAFLDSLMDTQTSFAWARELVAKIVKQVELHRKNDIVTQYNVYLFFTYFETFFTYYAHECDRGTVLYSLWLIGVELDVIRPDDPITRTEEFKSRIDIDNNKLFTKASLIETDLVYADQLYKFNLTNVDAYCPSGGLCTLNIVKQLEDINESK